jgi:hypothetical protein
LMMTSCRDPVGTDHVRSRKEAAGRAPRTSRRAARRGGHRWRAWFSSAPLGRRRPSMRVGQVLHAGTFAKTLSPACGLAWIAAGRYRVKLEQLKMSSGGSRGAQSGCRRRVSDRRWLRTASPPASKRPARAIGADGRGAPAGPPSGTRVFPPAGGCVLWVRLPEASMGSSCDGALGLSASAWRPVRCSPGVRGTGTSSGSGLASAGRSGRTAR